MSDFEVPMWVFYGGLLFCLGFASMVAMLVQALTE